MTIKDHLGSPEIGLDTYLRRRQIELASEHEHRHAIYLDLKYWITFRKAISGIETSSQAVALLELLRKQVRSGISFCPISESTFAELLKQGDLVTRQSTAGLIDELSLGVSLIPSEVRLNTELAHFIHTCGGKENDLYPLDQLVWTKLSYTLGNFYPSDTAFDAVTELALQKAFFDHLWSIPLSEIIVSMSGDLPDGEQDRFKNLAARLNHENVQHAGELKSFNAAYNIELSGVVDLVAEVAVAIVSDMAIKEGHAGLLRDSPAWGDYENQWKNLLIAAFSKDATKKSLRTMHINTCLHAAHRWNKSRKFEGNDFFDFHHACAALGYCDVFLTERSLKTMVTANHVALDKLYNCTVISDVSEAVTFVKSLT